MSKIDQPQRQAMQSRLGALQPLLVLQPELQQLQSLPQTRLRCVVDRRSRTKHFAQRRRLAKSVHFLNLSNCINYDIFIGIIIVISAICSLPTGFFNGDLYHAQTCSASRVRVSRFEIVFMGRFDGARLTRIEQKRERTNRSTPSVKSNSFSPSINLDNHNRSHSH